MKSNTIYRYFAFGYNFALLRTRTPKSSEHLVKEGIDSLVSFFTELDMPVTLEIAKELITAGAPIKLNNKDSVGDSRLKAVQDAMDRLDAAAKAELKRRTAYVLTSKRYPLDTLMFECGNLLGTGVFDSLSANTQTDFRLACKQVALEQPTSAAFHLMRALEAEVKALYLTFKKTNRLKVLMWGPMTDQLRNKNKPKPSEKLLSHLDGMRKHFRNPTQHPELFYSTDEAQDLLNSTIVAINMIRYEINQRGKQKSGSS
jgi:hypothetical protein